MKGRCGDVGKRGEGMGCKNEEKGKGGGGGKKNR